MLCCKHDDTRIVIALGCAMWGVYPVRNKNQALSPSRTLYFVPGTMSVISVNVLCASKDSISLSVFEHLWKQNVTFSWKSGSARGRICDLYSWGCRVLYSQDIERRHETSISLDMHIIMRYMSWVWQTLTYTIQFVAPQKTLFSHTHHKIVNSLTRAYT